MAEERWWQSLVAVIRLIVIVSPVTSLIKHSSVEKRSSV